LAPDDPKLICPLELKPELEAGNSVDQLDYIAHLVNDLKITELRESHVREPKAIAINGIYPCGSKYRDAFMRVRIVGSDHELPHESRIGSLVVELSDFVNNERSRRSVIERATYSLWRLNWIHPFAGGNGRTARAVAYLIICIENGSTLSGVPSMPALIAAHRDRYMNCLRAADEADRRGGLDISAMAAFLSEVLTQQLESAISNLT
jgi:Fic family protein